MIVECRVQKQIDCARVRQNTIQVAPTNALRTALLFRSTAETDLQLLKAAPISIYFSGTIADVRLETGD
jgi:hypothetical protein